MGIVRISLPDSCPLKIPPADADRIAASLRAKPELAQELTWHVSTIVGILGDVEILEAPIRELRRDLAKSP